MGEWANNSLTYSSALFLAFIVCCCCCIVCFLSIVCLCCSPYIQLLMTDRLYFTAYPLSLSKLQQFLLFSRTGCKICSIGVPCTLLQKLRAWPDAMIHTHPVLGVSVSFRHFFKGCTRCMRLVCNPFEMTFGFINFTNVSVIITSWSSNLRSGFEGSACFKISQNKSDFFPSVFPMFCDPLKIILGAHFVI